MGTDVTGEAVERLCRQGWARAVGALSRVCGRDEAESAVQEAFVRALKAWPVSGVPADPSAWLGRVARRCAVDAWRRRGPVSDADVERLFARTADVPEAVPDDATVRQLFACAAVPLPQATRQMLMLKEVCGLTVSQVAGVFGAKPQAAAQRLVRAKRELSPADFAADPGPSEASGLRDCVLDAVYLLFSAGFHELADDVPSAMELVAEAVRLAVLLADDRRTASPAGLAMAAAVVLPAARLGARRDDAGRLLSLAEQDRSRWDARLTDLGLRLLERSMEGTSLPDGTLVGSFYHLYAGIAAAHAVAKDFASTDWAEIAGSYDLLLDLEPGTDTRLGWLVARSYAEGPGAVLTETQSLLDDDATARDHRVYALLGDLHQRSGDGAAARRAYGRAAALAPREAERAWLSARAGQGRA